MTKQKPKNKEWLIASPLTNCLIDTVRDEQKETLEHIKTHGVWVDSMYHEPTEEGEYLRITFKRGENSKKMVNTHD